MFERLEQLEEKVMEKVMEKFSIEYKFKAPDKRVDAKRDFPIKYYCTQSQIDWLQDRMVAPRNEGDKYIDVNTAVAALEGIHLDRASVDRLQKFGSEFLRLVLVDPTVIFKVFNDLDRVFFGNKLEGNVFLRLKDSAKLAYGFASPRGIDSKRVSITINTRQIYYRDGKLATYADLMETLLHEMIHAYIFVSCGLYKGHQGNNEPVTEAPGFIPGRNADGRHGAGFQMALTVVQNKLDQLGGRWSRIDMRQKGYY